MTNKLTDLRFTNINNILKTAKLESSNLLFGLNNNSATENFFDKSESKSGEDNDTKKHLNKGDFKLKKVIDNLNCSLQYLSSGGNGHTFKGVNEKKEILYAIKVVAYIKYNDFGSYNNLTRPENSELCMLKLLSYFVFKKMTPHILLPIMTFDTDIKQFVNLQKKGVVPEKNETYTKFVNNYKKNCYHKKVSVLVSEWANKGDLGAYLKINYENLSLLQWKCLFFQIISVLATIQNKYPSFRHNDLKANNILVSDKNVPRRGMGYKINGVKYNVPSCGVNLFLWDFDFACIPGVVENLKLYQEWTNDMNINTTINRYYDIHFLFCTLTFKAFLPKLFESLKVPIEVKNFINHIIPPEYKANTAFVNDKGRLIQNVEYITPAILLTNSFFDTFRQ
jgi:serine/threonine protein kinase